jgi:tripartite-type tricarboxylate transporter receptor subunit TctC
LKAPELQAAFARDGASPVTMSTAEFSDYIKKEIVKWARVVQQGKITAK